MNLPSILNYQRSNTNSAGKSVYWLVLLITTFITLTFFSSSTVYAGDQIFKYYNDTLYRNGVKRVKGKGELGYRSGGNGSAINKYCLSDLSRDGDAVYIESRMTSWGRNGYLRNEKKKVKTQATRNCGEHVFALRGDETQVRISAKVCVDHGWPVPDTCKYTSVRFRL